MDRDELAAWLQLLEAPGVGRETARKLLAAFGSPQAVLAATTAARRQVVGPRAAEALESLPGDVEALITTTQAWLAETGQGLRRVLTLGDADYPSALFQTPDPPVLLYAQGRLELLRGPTLAVVGSRNPTPGGVETRQGLRHQPQPGRRDHRVGPGLRHRCGGP